MAEQVHVERRRPVWPWILLALLILALFLLFMWYRGTPHDDEVLVPIEPAAQEEIPAETPDTAQALMEESAAPAEVSAPAEVTGFVRFVEETRAQAAGPSHDYTADGLRQLAAALDAMSRTQVALASAADASKHIAAVREWADAMQRDPQSLEHADQARAAFVAAAQAMEVLQSASPGAEQAVQAVRDSAAEIDTARPMLEQATRIEACFDRSAEALRSLSQSAA